MVSVVFAFIFLCRIRFDDCAKLFNENSLIFRIVAVKVKWGRENFPNIEVNTDEDPMVFKAQLFALTGVQPHRQKVMCKGVALKDDEWNFQLRDVCYLACSPGISLKIHFYSRYYFFNSGCGNFIAWYKG